ncbi:MAG TPA: oligosaccharide flippase family protein, partial [Clostridia bacterium]
MCGLLILNKLCRYLTISEFGNFSLAFSFVYLAQPIVDFGMNSIAIREISRDNNNAGSLLSGVIIAKLCLAIISIFTTIAVVMMLGYKLQFQLIVLLASLSLIIFAFGAVEVIFVVNGRLILSSFSQLVSTLAQLGAVLLVINFEGTIYRLILAYVCAGGVGSALLYLFASRLVIFQQPDFARLIEFIKVTIPQGIASIIVAIYFNIDAVLVSKILGNEAVAYYGAAYRFLGFMIFFPHALLLLFLPALARCYSNNWENFAKLFRRIFYILMVIGVPAATWTMLYAESIVNFVYSAYYQPSVIVLKILVWGGVATFASHLFGYALVYANLQKHGLLVSIIALAANILANVVLIPRCGI